MDKKTTTPKERYTRFKLKLGSAHNNILGRLGYCGRHGNKLDYWLGHLAALGLLSSNKGHAGDIPSVQSIDIKQAAEHGYAFLLDIADVARSVAQSSGNGSAVFGALCDAATL